MATAPSNVLREYLIRLAYEVDQTSERRFLTSFAKAGEGVAAFVIAMKAAALAVKGAVLVMSGSLDEVYFASKRIGSSVAEIQGFSYAIRQLGGTAQDARSALESMATFLRSSPGAEGFLRSVGVQTRDARGQLRSTTELYNEFFATQRRLPPEQQYLALARSRMIGIDERTALMSLHDDGRYQAQYNQMLRTTGYNPDRAAQEANKIRTELRLLGAAFDIFKNQLVSSLFGTTGQSLAQFRQWFVTNMGAIRNVVMEVVRVILDVGQAFNRFAIWSYTAGKSLLGWLLSFIGGWKTLHQALAVMRHPIVAFQTLLWLLGKDLQIFKSYLLSLIPREKIEKDLQDWSKLWHDLVDPFKTSMIELKRSIIAVYDYLDEQNKKMTGGDLLGFGQAIKDIHQMIKVLGDLGHVLVEIGAAMDELNKGNFSGALGHLQEALKYMGPHPPGEETGSGRMPGMGAASGTPSPTGDTAALERESYDFWIRKGATPEGAATMVSMESRESGFDWRKWGDNGQARGAFQWHKDRRDNILARTGIDVWADNSTHGQQLEAWFQEGSQSIDPQYGAAFQQMMHPNSLLTGVKAGTYEAERPRWKTVEMIKRYMMAQGILHRHGARLGDYLPESTAGAREPLPFGNINRAPNARDDPTFTRQLWLQGPNYPAMLVPDPDRAMRFNYGNDNRNGAGAGVVQNNNTTINVEGANQPEETARRVGQEQRGVNQDNFRYARSVVR